MLLDKGPDWLHKQGLDFVAFRPGSQDEMRSEVNVSIAVTCIKSNGTEDITEDSDVTTCVLSLC